MNRDRMTSRSLAAALALAALAVPAVLAAQEAAPTPDAPAAGSDIVVSATGLRNDSGSLRCYLFASAEGFPTRPASAIARDVTPLTGGRAGRCAFRNVAPGIYAVAIHHDEDGDGRFDTGIFGIPTEGTAASRDARGSMGPPSFDAARITHGPAPTRLDVRMQYVF
jgi:uncharacterized protein (DUF2141 family)